jgi:hypothetical protein
MSHSLTIQVKTREVASNESNGTDFMVVHAMELQSKTELILVGV